MRLPQRILIAGFSGFGKISNNPSAEIAFTLSTYLQEEFEANMKVCVLPASQSVCTTMMSKAIKSFMPDLTIIIGTHVGEDEFFVEAFAENTQTVNPGLKGQEVEAKSYTEPAIKQAEKTLETSFDVDSLAENMTKNGLETYISENPSMFACNQAYFVALHETASKNGEALLIHVPIDALGSHNISRRITNALSETLKGQPAESNA